MHEPCQQQHLFVFIYKFIFIFLPSGISMPPAFCVFLQYRNITMENHYFLPLSKITQSITYFFYMLQIFIKYPFFSMPDFFYSSPLVRFFSVFFFKNYFYKKISDYYKKNIVYLLRAVTALLFLFNGTFLAF